MPVIPHNDKKIISAIAAKHKIPDLYSVKRFSSGQVNCVYEINNALVLKIKGKRYRNMNMFGCQPELLQMLHAAGAKVADLYDYGTVENVEYLLMKKIPGRNLSYDWISLSDDVKESLIAEIAEQLKIFHSLNSPEYRLPIVSSSGHINLRNAVIETADFNSVDVNKLPKQYRENVNFLENFFNERSSCLEESDSAVFVHNDLNLENILWKDNHIAGIIDMDWVCYAPKDYEFKRIAHYTHTPKDGLEKQLHPVYKNYKMTKEIGWLKKFYPELFEVENLADRVRCYMIYKMLGTVHKYTQGVYNDEDMEEWGQQIEDYYKNSWLNELLEN